MKKRATLPTRERLLEELVPGMAIDGKSLILPALPSGFRWVVTHVDRRIEAPPYDFVSYRLQFEMTMSPVT